MRHYFVSDIDVNWRPRRPKSNAVMNKIARIPSEEDRVRLCEYSGGESSDCRPLEEGLESSLFQWFDFLPEKHLSDRVDMGSEKISLYPQLRPASSKCCRGFRLATPLSKKTHEAQLRALCYAMFTFRLHLLESGASPLGIWEIMNSS